MLNRRFLMLANTKKSRLPSEYQEVEYIESTGTQYIDTNYIPVIGNEIEITYSWTTFEQTALFSAGIGVYQFILLGNMNRKGFYFKYFATGVAKEIPSNETINFFSTIKIDKNGYVYKNDFKYPDMSTPITELDGTSTTLYLMARRNNSSFFKGKISKFIIKDSDNEIINLIPCYRKLDNVIGMYDVVNNIFYTNKGTGKFLKGDDVN